MSRETKNEKKMKKLLIFMAASIMAISAHADNWVSCRYTPIPGAVFYAQIQNGVIQITTDVVKEGNIAIKYKYKIGTSNQEYEKEVLVQVSNGRATLKEVIGGAYIVDIISIHNPYCSATK